MKMKFLINRKELTIENLPYNSIVGVELIDGRKYILQYNYQEKQFILTNGTNTLHGDKDYLKSFDGVKDYIRPEIHIFDNLKDLGIWLLTDID